MASGEKTGAAAAKVWIDAPTADAGGVQIGTVAFDADALTNAESKETASDGTVWSWVNASMDASVTGVHPVYFVFESDSDGIICGFDQFVFSK